MIYLETGSWLSYIFTLYFPWCSAGSKNSTIIVIENGRKLEKYISKSILAALKLEIKIS